MEWGNGAQMNSSVLKLIAIRLQNSLIIYGLIWTSFYTPLLFQDCVFQSMFTVSGS